MKKYNIGDTVYLKATVAKVDENDPEKTYGVNFVHGTYGIQVWPQSEAFIDELPVVEPVKPKLHEKLARELEEAKSKEDVTFNIYINLGLGGMYKETSEFLGQDTKTIDSATKLLAKAWYDGYTTYKFYNLILGKREDMLLQAAFLKITDWDDNTYLSLNAGSVPHDLTIPQYQFTQEEIDKYNENLWIKNLDLNDYKVEVKDDEEV